MVWKRQGNLRHWEEKRAKLAKDLLCVSVQFLEVTVLSVDCLLSEFWQHLLFRKWMLEKKLFIRCFLTQKKASNPFLCAPQLLVTPNCNFTAANDLAFEANFPVVRGVI